METTVILNIEATIILRDEALDVTNDMLQKKCTEALVNTKQFDKVEVKSVKQFVRDEK